MGRSGGGGFQSSRHQEDFQSGGNELSCVGNIAIVLGDMCEMVC